MYYREQDYIMPYTDFRGSITIPFWLILIMDFKNPLEIMVYAIIYNGNTEHKDYLGGYDKLAQLTKTTKRTIKRVVQDLKDRNYLKITKLNGYNCISCANIEILEQLEAKIYETPRVTEEVLEGYRKEFLANIKISNPHLAGDRITPTEGTEFPLAGEKISPIEGKIVTSQGKKFHLAGEEISPSKGQNFTSQGTKFPLETSKHHIQNGCTPYPKCNDPLPKMDVPTTAEMDVPTPPKMDNINKYINKNINKTLLNEIKAKISFSTEVENSFLSTQGNTPLEKNTKGELPREDSISETKKYKLNFISSKNENESIRNEIIQANKDSIASESIDNTEFKDNTISKNTTMTRFKDIIASKLNNHADLQVKLQNVNNETRLIRKQLYQQSKAEKLQEKKEKLEKMICKIKDSVVEFTSNVELQNLLIAYSETYRELIKPTKLKFKIETWKLLLEKLKNLTTKEEEQIEIVTNSITCGYKTFYELKKYQNKKDNREVNSGLGIKVEYAKQEDIVDIKF